MINLETVFELAILFVVSMSIASIGFLIFESFSLWYCIIFGSLVDMIWGFIRLKK